MLALWLYGRDGSGYLPSTKYWGIPATVGRSWPMSREAGISLKTRLRIVALRKARPQCVGEGGEWFTLSLGDNN